MDSETNSEVSSNLTIRALPTSVRRTLAARAKARRISLNALAVEVLTREAQTPTMGEWLAELDRVRLPTGLSGDDVAEAVRAVREERDAKWA
jgi:post-segregation antitoxin (ccd killing protein)